MKAITLFFITIAFTTATADEWGDWGDLPDNLLDHGQSSSYSIDQLYDQLKQLGSDEIPDNVMELEIWLQSIDIAFTDNEEFEDLLNHIKDESPDDVAEELDKWLEDQLEDITKEQDELQDDLDDALEEELKDLEDELEDDLEDELDESDDNS